MLPYESSAGSNGLRKLSASTSTFVNDESTRKTIPCRYSPLSGTMRFSARSTITFPAASRSAPPMFPELK
jgi:hypothetical protein